MERDQAFLPRLKTAGYEIWFSVLMDAAQGIALWTRYTILVPTQGKAVGVLWGAFFDRRTPENHIVRTKMLPLSGSPFADSFQTSFPDAPFSADALRGVLPDLSWDLHIEHDFESESHVPRILMNSPLAATRSWIVSPFGRFGGVITVDRRKYTVSAMGTWTHIVGQTRVPQLYWCFVPEFDEANVGVEVFSVRPRTSMPRITFATIRRGKRLEHRSWLEITSRGLRAEFPSLVVPRLGLTARLNDLQAARYIYLDPGGTNRYVIQSDASPVSIIDSGRNLTTQLGAVEFHGMAPWDNRPFVDAYR